MTGDRKWIGFGVLALIVWQLLGCSERKPTEPKTAGAGEAQAAITPAERRPLDLLHFWQLLSLLSTGVAVEPLEWQI